MTASFTKRYIAARRARPILWELIDLVAGSAGVVLLWYVARRTAGIAAAILWGLLTLAGWIVLVARIKRERRES